MNPHGTPRPHATHPIRLAAVAACVTACVACGGTDEAAPPAVELDGGVDIELVAAPEQVRFGPLSPDGRLAAYAGADEVCVLEIATRNERCAPVTARPWDASLRFAPDGSQVLFVDDFVRQLFEPDVHLLDLTTMEVSNLTDDGVDAVALGGDDPTGSTDLAATWMPDGSIVFVRAAGMDGAPTLMRMTPGEEPTAVADLAGIVDAGELVAPLEPAGEDAVTGITIPVSGDAEMIRVDLGSGEASTVATFGEADGRVQLVGVSEPAGVALVAYADVIALDAPDRHAHALVDLGTGDVRPLLDGVDDADGDPVRSALAALTPDGTAVVFGRAGLDRLGLYTVATEAALGTAGFDDVVRIGELPGAFGGAEVLGWNPVAPMVWTADGALIGRVGFDALATVRFGDPG